MIPVIISNLLISALVFATLFYTGNPLALLGLLLLQRFDEQPAQQPMYVMADGLEEEGRPIGFTADI